MGVLATSREVGNRAICSWTTSQCEQSHTDHLGIHSAGWARPGGGREAEVDHLPKVESEHLHGRLGHHDLVGVFRVARKINGADPDQPASGRIAVLHRQVIASSGSIEIVPTLLGSGVAAGAVVALGITLVASVRRRRHDLAIM